MVLAAKTKTTFPSPSKTACSLLPGSNSTSCSVIHPLGARAASPSSDKKAKKPTKTSLSSATTSGPAPATSSSTSCSTSKPCSKSRVVQPSSSLITFSSRVVPVKRFATTCSGNVTYTPFCVFPPASSTRKASKQTSSSSTASRRKRSPGRKSYGSTTCAPTRTSPCAPTSSRARTSTISYSATIQRTVLIVKRASVFAGSATTNWSGATKSTWTSSGCVTKAWRAPTTSCPRTY